MSRWMNRWKKAALAAALAALAASAQAQFTVNGQTNTVSGTGVAWPGGYYVGSNTSFNVLAVTDGGTLSNGAGHIGFAATASNSLAYVAGAGSLWTNSGEFNAGYSGSGNRLVVTNGGRVAVALNAFVGRSWFVRDNEAVVSGPGSTLLCGGYLSVGHMGNATRLVVSDGALVRNASYGVVGNYAGGNSALVTGAGTRWESPSDLFVGKTDGVCTNLLLVMDGATVLNASGTIGYNPGATGNVMIVNGAGTLWTNTAGVTVGYNGARNQLVVGDGAQVVGISSYVGLNASASNNRTRISGPGSLWRNRDNFEMGSKSSGNETVVTNGGVLANRYAYVGSSSNDNALTVSGPGSLWTNWGTIAVGRNGSNNRLVIEDGGAVYTPSMSVGLTPGNTGNVVLVGRDALLDANTLIVTNTGNAIRCPGGILQFSSAAPAILTSIGSATGIIQLAGGILSFRGIANAPLGGGILSSITFTGDNGYRLYGATNTAVASYAFDSTANTGNPATYQALHLGGLNPRWQGTSLTIGAGGLLSVSNTCATVAAALTHHGALRIVEATVAFTQEAAVNGTVVIDLDRLASTNGVALFEGLDLGGSSTLALSGGSGADLHERVLIRYSGARQGEFGSVSGLPPKMVLQYGPAADGWIRLARARSGALLVVR